MSVAPEEDVTVNSAPEECNVVVLNSSPEEVKEVVVSVSASPEGIVETLVMMNPVAVPFCTVCRTLVSTERVSPESANECRLPVISNRVPIIATGSACWDCTK